MNTEITNTFYYTFKIENINFLICLCMVSKQLITDKTQLPVLNKKKLNNDFIIYYHILFLKAFMCLFRRL